MFSHQPNRASIKAVAALFCGLMFFASRAYGAEESEHRTSTPIKHVVVIFEENVSFDHYFATYPVALNPPGEPQFDSDGNED